MIFPADICALCDAVGTVGQFLRHDPEQPDHRGRRHGPRRRRQSPDGRLRLFPATRWRRWRSAPSGMIAICLLPPIVVTLLLFPLADYLGLQRYAHPPHPPPTHASVLGLSLRDDPGKRCSSTRCRGSWTKPLVDDGAARRLADASPRSPPPPTLQGMAAGGLFVFIFSWNELLFAPIFAGTPARQDRAAGHQRSRRARSTGTEWSVLSRRRDHPASARSDPRFARRRLQIRVLSRPRRR